VVALAAGILGVVATTAPADDGGHNRNAIDTRADFTPFEAFKPLAASSPCTGEPGGRQSKPFVIPAGYQQQVFAEETDNRLEDLWDMHTQNESGKDRGRYGHRDLPRSDRPAGAGWAGVRVLPRRGRSEQARPVS